MECKFKLEISFLIEEKIFLKKKQTDHTLLILFLSNQSAKELTHLKTNFEIPSVLQSKFHSDNGIEVQEQSFYFHVKQILSKETVFLQLKYFIGMQR